jgi:hypothetical protein
MKLRNLFGLISCFFIAFSGTSYSQSSGSSFSSPPSFSPPPPTTPFVAPSIPLTGGSVPSDITGTVNTGVKEKDYEKCANYLCALDKGRDEGAALARKIIKEIHTQETTRSTHYAAFLYYLDVQIYFREYGEVNTLGKILKGEIEKTKRNQAGVAAQRIEFSLRRVETRYTKAADKPDCDALCSAYYEGKSHAVGKFHDGFVKALAYAKIDLLQSRIPK